ncbi:MAG: hypothetical protein KAS32_27125 [Candidatus Peribacteraceae bacterium]|nr:hypothetical protein [Candidatus Peribacteraceae bacterium]
MEQIKENPYLKSRIYKIVHKETGDLYYVGGTIQPITRRLAQHRSASKKQTEIEFYKAVIGCGGWEQFSVFLIENFPCTSKEELTCREQELIIEMGPLHNTRYAKGIDPVKKKESQKRTNKRYYEKNAQYMRERSKAFHIVLKGKAQLIDELRRKSNELCRCPQCGAINEIIMKFIDADKGLNVESGYDSGKEEKQVDLASDDDYNLVEPDGVSIQVPSVSVTLEST